jgi:hypothetical protein
MTHQNVSMIRRLKRPKGSLETAPNRPANRTAAWFAVAK